MATYYWSPIPDASIDNWLVQRAQQTFSKVLPRRCNHNDYPDHTGTQGRWSEIRSYDTIYICAHGVASSLSKVGWASAAGVIKWDAQGVADMFTTNLTIANRPLNLLLDIQLTACWGANQFTVLTDSFGKKLSRKLKKAGIMGTLTAYKGATQLNPYDDYQIGSSRFTSGLLHWKITGVGNTAAMEANATRNRLGVRVAIKREDASVSWTLANP